MSLRKVSDLEGITIPTLYDQGLSINLMNSLIEISYLSSNIVDENTVPTFSYRSMAVRYGEIRDDIISAIIYPPDGNMTFYSHVHLPKGECLSTNFYMNYQLSRDQILNGDREYGRGKGYECFIKSTFNTIYAIGTDNNGKNLIWAENENILKAPKTRITYNDDTDIAVFDPDLITFNANVEISGDITANEFKGVALSARWADLAEIYETDMAYDPGTIVKFGGSKEITIATDYANAVITTKPGFILNSNQIGQGIALIGRTPVKVIGTSKKFENIYLSPFNPGIGATKNTIKELANTCGYYNINSLQLSLVGKTLAEKHSKGIDLVECVVKMEF